MNLHKTSPDIHLIILLGSYDPDTKSLLYEVKDYIAQSFQEEIYPIILEDVELYTTTNPSYAVMIDKQGFTTYLFHGVALKDVLYLGSVCTSLDEKCLSGLDSILREKYNVGLKEKTSCTRKIVSLSKIV